MTMTRQYILYYPEQNEPSFEVLTVKDRDAADLVTNLLLDAFPDCKVALGPISNLHTVVKAAEQTIRERIESGEIETVAS